MVGFFYKKNCTRHALIWLLVKDLFNYRRNSLIYLLTFSGSCCCTQWPADGMYLTWRSGIHLAEAATMEMDRAVSWVPQMMQQGTFILQPLGGSSGLYLQQIINYIFWVHRHQYDKFYKTYSCTVCTDTKKSLQTYIVSLHGAKMPIRQLQRYNWRYLISRH